MELKIFGLLAILVTLTLSQNCCSRNTIQVSGNSEIKVKPDFATIDIGATAKQKTTSAALQSLNQKISQIIRTIEGQGVAKKDYSTSSLTLSQAYEYRNNENVLVGQSASQTLSVKIRDISNDGAAIGRLIDAVSKVDGLSISGVTFDQSNRTLGVKQARKAAFEDAKKKAQEYANLSGMRLRKVTKIDALSSGNVRPFSTISDAFAGDFKTQVPVRDVTISESVTVWFETLP